MRISDWSSDVCSSDLPSQVGRARLEAQRRVSPSAGGLHPIHLVCIKSEQSAAKLYEPSTHGFRVLQTDHARVHQANEREVSAVLGANRGCTVRFIADAIRVSAAYEHPESLILRDAGALLATLCFYAEWLGLAACPLGFLGRELVEELGFPSDKFAAVGGVQISA